MKRLFVKILNDQRMSAFCDQGVVSASNFVTMLIVARQLTHEEFGLFSLAMMSMLFLGNLHRAVFTQPMNILGALELKPQLAGRMLALLKAHWFAIPIAFAVLAVASFCFYPQMLLLASVAIYVASFFLQEMLRRYWYTLGHSGDVLRNDLISYAGQVALLLLAGLVWKIDGPIAFFIMAVTSIVAFMVGLKRLGLSESVEHRTTRAVLVEQWGLAKWLLLTVLAVWGAGQVYPFLMAPLGAIAVASFSACRNLLNALGVVIQSIGNYLPAQAARLLREGGTKALRRHILRTLSQALVLAAVFLSTIEIFAEPLLHLAYAGRYDSAAPLLKILAWGTVSTLLATIMGSYSLAMEDSRSGFFANLGASAVTFTVGLWLIKNHGADGAAMATAISLATAALLQGILVLVRFRRLPSGTSYA